MSEAAVLLCFGPFSGPDVPIFNAFKMHNLDVEKIQAGLDPEVTSAIANKRERIYGFATDMLNSHHF